MTAETAGPPDARADARTVPTAPEVTRRSPAFADGLWVDRIGSRRYLGHNARGAQVLVGPAEAGEVFTPGELMKIALAGCSGMSTDASLARRLGDDVAVSVHVSGPSDPAEVRYPTLHEELVVDLTGLSREDRIRVETVIRRAIDRSCTVGRTLQQSADVELTVSSRSGAGPAVRDAVTGGPTLSATGPVPVSGARFQTPRSGYEDTR